MSLPRIDNRPPGGTARPCLIDTVAHAHNSDSLLCFSSCQHVRSMFDQGALRRFGYPSPECQAKQTCCSLNPVTAASFFETRERNPAHLLPLIDAYYCNLA